MGVPLLDLKAQFQTIRDETLAAVREVFESQYFILGPTVQAFEAAAASYCGSRFAWGVSSGTDALLIALMAENIGVGDEVIVPTYSFFATGGCVTRTGAKPVFVDIEPVGYNIDAEKIEAVISPRTRAIIPVHLYGQCADMDAILRIAKKHNLVVIEDAAQAIGAEYKGQRAGSMGHYGCFSFFPSKNLGGAGDGGLVTTDDPDRSERLRILRVHGGEPKYVHHVIGGNFRMDALQAAVLAVKLPHLDAWTAARQRNAETYRRLFTERHLTIEPSSAPSADAGGVEEAGVLMPAELPERRHIYNQFIIRVSRRDELRQWLTERQIGHEVYYPVPFHLQPCFADLGHNAGDFPVSERAASQTLALPIYPELTEAQQTEVADALAAFFCREGV